MYSLSYYFEFLRQKQIRRGYRKLAEDAYSTTDLVAALKVLKDSPQQPMPLTALARATGLRFGPCEELVEHLEDEGLVEVEEDERTGNDLIALTQKGEELL